MNHEERHLDLLRLIIAVFIPPLAVATQVGLGIHFWLNIALTLLGWVPGVLHAAWVILSVKNDE